MGACADMFQDAVEKVGEDFAFDRITHEEGMKELRRLGFDHDESLEMLAAAKA